MSTTGVQRQFPCTNCGANLVFEPGQNALKCPYCQTENRIAVAAEPVEEIDFRQAMEQLRRGQETRDVLTVRCSACGAESTLNTDITADCCPFCGSAIVAQAGSRKLIRPRYLLPFKITRQQAMASFRQWVDSLWFAPNDLRRLADASAVKGVYIPYWTYDCDTESWYTGARGEDYWATETYAAYENGRDVTRTRQVRKTRWYPALGRVRDSFDDILILASNSLPRSCTQRLEPWDLGNLVPYGDEYLAGFVAESYQVDLEQGFELAKPIMDEAIRATIRRHIGGDHQRIDTVQTRYDQITFKHILLPLWISAYRYRDRTFRFLVNARTGEVSGQRPYSGWKIFLAVLAGLLIAGAVAFLISQR